MSNEPSLPVQVADAPDSSFRAPIYEINPAAGPQLRHIAPVPHPVPVQHAAAACPPAAVNSNIPPVVVHEPAAGQHVNVVLTPNQPLVFDFNPLDATATRHGDDLTLTFADGGVVVLHHIEQAGNPLPTPLTLPDGTVIDPCELLQALPQISPEADHGKIPSNEKDPEINPGAGPPLNEINPGAGPTPILVPGAHPVVTPFEVPGLGNGLTPLGPLPPEGFTTTVEFPPPGSGGFPPGPPGSPTPPGPPGPPSGPLGPEDEVFLHWPTGTATGNFFTDMLGSTSGDSITSFYSEAENPGYVFGATPIDPGTPDGAPPTLGYLGELTMTSNGAYNYTLSNTNALGINVVGTPGQEGVVAALGSDLTSQTLTEAFLNANVNLSVPLQDTFYLQGATGAGAFGNPTTDATSLVFGTYGANVHEVTGTVTTAAPVTTGELLVTYTDAVDPAHSFQAFVTATSGGSFSLGAALGSLPFQPTDPGLISIENLTGGSVTVTGMTVAGESESNPLVLDNGTNHALTFMIDPDLSGSGDPGDIGSSSAANLSNTAAGTFNDSLSSGALTYANASFTYGNDYSTTGVVTGTDSADILQSTTGGEVGGVGTDVLVYNSTTQATGFNYDGGFGLNLLRLDSAGSLDFTAAGSTINNATTATGAGTENQIQLANGDTFANIETIDLTAAAQGGSATNALTLNASDVFALTQNEPAVVSATGPSNNMWVLGTASDTVNLTGGGWSEISGSITQSGQNSASAAPGIGAVTSTITPTQMVGFTEFSSVDPTSHNTVHVYVANAIAQAGHVHLA